MSATTTKSPGGVDSPPAPPVEPPAGAPPAPPQEPFFELPVDEGPMRRELLRQIALLEQELTSRSKQWSLERATPRRGPALQTNEQLEGIRDELVAALDKLRAA